MKPEWRVSYRYKRAQDEPLDQLADTLADQFLLELAGMEPFNEMELAHALAEKGVDADDLNSLSPIKTAGPLVRVLGGLVAKGLWYVLVRPFLVLNKVLRSPKFRREIKMRFKRALRKDVRATRHLQDVGARWARGDYVHPQEFQTAKEQLLRILAKVVLMYFAAPELGALFSGGVWHAITGLWFSAQELLIILLDRPLGEITKRLLTAPTGMD